MSVSALQIAIDVMSGDCGPSVCVPAALAAAREFPDVRFILIGGRSELDGQLAAAKLANVRLELSLLEKTWTEAGAPAVVAAEEHALQAVNERLWDIEDRIRDKEAHQTFDRDFVELARSVYVCNDERAALKKRINVQLGSRLVEEKSYKQYR